ncbi:MAG: archease [Candidatus Omnitrophica bacterium]|nr:archease [Candidatus Omnitrophota bacterium]
MHKFEIIEHAADVGLRVYGKDYKELFLNAAWGACALLVDDLPSERDTRPVELTASTIEDLLVDWLNELVSLFYAEKFLPKDIEIQIHQEESSCELVAELIGGQYDPYTQKVNMEVKAATHHKLHIEQKEEYLETQIIFDV